MKNFCLITNTYKDPGQRITEEIAGYIRERGGRADCLSTDAGRGDGREFSPEEISPDTECIMVLGGDGTLIRVAARIEHLNIPMVGVNLGTLGYLCELERATVPAAIDRLMENSYTSEERMMLCGRLSGEEEGRSALNDIVIRQLGTLSILTLKVYVNGEYLSTYDADGVIVATPTGATGYNLSAGGPIVDPKARMILLTPINAHNLNARSIVLNGDCVVEIVMEGRRGDGREAAVVSIDGDTYAQLVPGERFLVQADAGTTRILRLNKENFLEILRRKLANE